MSMIDVKLYTKIIMASFVKGHEILYFNQEGKKVLLCSS